MLLNLALLRLSCVVRTCLVTVRLVTTLPVILLVLNITDLLQGSLVLDSVLYVLCNCRVNVPRVRVRLVWGVNWRLMTVTPWYLWLTRRRTVVCLVLLPGKPMVLMAGALL